MARPADDAGLALPGVEREFARVNTPRVLHIDTERGWRGGERQLLWLAQALARRGHSTVIAARPGEPLAARAAEAGIALVPCAPRSEIDVVAAWRLRRAIGRYDIGLVHAHTAHAVALAALATLGLDRVPFVAARRVDFQLKKGMGTRLKYGRAATIIAVSEAVARVLGEGGIGASRVAVVPDGTDIHRAVVPADRGTLAGFGVPVGAPLVVQVAQLVGHKDPLTFVAAVEIMHGLTPNAHALLVGDGPLRTRVDDAVRERGMGSYLHVLGYRTDADRLLAATDVVCLSSKEEGMGSVLLDALVFGRPVVATRAGGIPEVVVDGVTGLLVPVGDAAALGQALARLATDPELRDRMGAAARNLADRFSVERMADRTLAIYEEVLGGAPPAAASVASSAASTFAP